MGEYVGRMYRQMQGRPAYFVAYDSLHPTPAEPGVETATRIPRPAQDDAEMTETGTTGRADLVVGRAGDPPSR
jgi:dolichol-phosphate mannosyltransferase